MRKKVIWIAVLMCLSVVIFAFSLIKYKQRQQKNTIDVSAVNDTAISTLDPIEYIELPSQIDNDYALTTTGLCFDENSQSYYVGNYGKAKKNDTEFHPSIVNVTSDFSAINYVLYFDENNKTDLQGVAYDNSNSSLWYTDGVSIINCDSSDGSELSRFSIGEYHKYKANGICVDTEDDSLWVLCSYKYLLHFDKGGTLLETFNCEYIGQDHITMDENGLIYISAGMDYQGENNFVICMDQDANILMIYRVKESYAVEGLIVLDEKMYIVNDGIYHEAKIRKNYIQVYNIPR